MGCTARPDRSCAPVMRRNGPDDAAGKTSRPSSTGRTRRAPCTDSPHRRGDARHRPGRRRGGRLRQRRPGRARSRALERVARVARRRLAPRVPGARVRRGPLPGQVVEAARPVHRGRPRGARRRERGGARTLLLGFSMGGAVAIAAAGEPRRRARWSAWRRGSPTASTSRALAAGASPSSTARSTAGFPASPASARAARARGLRAGARAGRRGQLHAHPRRGPRDRPARAAAGGSSRSRAPARWARLVAGELARFQAGAG